jgi:leucyl aminopeptidase
LTLTNAVFFFFFYSGGYNIKTGPGCSIELMKFDMGGSAATFGAAKAIAQIKPPGVEVTIFPAKVVV